MSEWQISTSVRELQAEGARSAKCKLKRLAKKEHRFMADANHQVAKWIVNQPFDVSR